MDWTISSVIPVASTTKLGCVKRGGNINFAPGGSLNTSIATGAIATNTATAVVKGGGNISIDGDGTLSANIPTGAMATKLNKYYDWCSQRRR